MLTTVPLNQAVVIHTDHLGIIMTVPQPDGSYRLGQVLGDGTLGQVPAYTPLRGSFANNSHAIATVTRLDAHAPATYLVAGRPALGVAAAMHIHRAETALAKTTGQLGKAIAVLAHDLAADVRMGYLRRYVAWCDAHSVIPVHPTSRRQYLIATGDSAPTLGALRAAGITNDI